LYRAVGYHACVKRDSVDEPARSVDGRVRHDVDPVVAPVADVLRTAKARWISVLDLVCVGARVCWRVLAGHERARNIGRRGNSELAMSNAYRPTRLGGPEHARACARALTRRFFFFNLFLAQFGTRLPIKNGKKKKRKKEKKKTVHFLWFMYLYEKDRQGPRDFLRKLAQ
jgi:hypothetical protein